MTPEQWQNDGSREVQKNNELLANGLGWFSIGLGVAELLVPGKLADLIGVTDKNGNRTLLRAYGLREIAAGIGILSQSRPTAWVWARVAGDVVDLASLGAALVSDDTSRARVSAAAAAVAGVTALDVICAQQLSQSSSTNETGTNRLHVTSTIIVDRSPEEVYAFWRDIKNLPTFMSHVKSVEMTGDNRSHWKVEGPMRKTVEWDAEMMDDEPGKRLAWRSLEGSDVEHSGSVTFERATGGRGTLVTVSMQYAPPGGNVTAMVSKLFRAEPGQQIEEDLRALKQVMETGEVIKSDASIHRGMHPAQPPEAAAELTA
ncbi:MAG: SRPBCC family protein [Acidobacteriaceae bacterium]|nr:SRPBCC family protein [Acidobacteriaceae bacterium]